MKQKLLAILIVVIGSYFILSISRQIYRLYKTQDLVTNAQNKLDILKSEQQALKEQLDYQKSNEFIEKEARNKLGLVKPNEAIVVLPNDKSEDQSNLTSSDSNFGLWWQAVFN